MTRDNYIYLSIYLLSTCGLQGSPATPFGHHWDVQYVNFGHPGGSQGSPTITLGGSRGAHWRSRRGETLVFLKNTRFVSTRAPLAHPRSHIWLLGSLWAARRDGPGKSRSLPSDPLGPAGTPGPPRNLLREPWSPPKAFIGCLRLPFFHNFT